MGRSGWDEDNRACPPCSPGHSPQPTEPVPACSVRGVHCACHSKKVLRNVQAHLLFLLSLGCALIKKYGKCVFEKLCFYKSEENNPKGKVFTTHVCRCKGQMPEVMVQRYWSLWLTSRGRAVLLGPVPTIRPSILVYLASMSADWDSQEFFGVLLLWGMEMRHKIDTQVGRMPYWQENGLWLKTNSAKDKHKTQPSLWKLRTL